MPRAVLGRNAPCSCGSGRKYRHCHGRTTRLRRSFRAGWVLATVLVVVGGILAIRGFHRSEPASQRVMNAPAGAVLPPPGKVFEGGLEPAPYTYDARNNRHWDPDHHHWHFGPPPSEAERLARAASGALGPREVAAMAAPLPQARDSSRVAARSR
jgi:hypothetical protein